MNKPANSVFASVLAGVTLLVAAPCSLAQDAALKPPQAISTEGRFMPGVGNEAIARARYTVKADGSTDDVEIDGIFSNQFLDRMLRDTVRDWTFEPATADGEPVEVYNQEYLFALRVDPNAPPPAGPGQRGPARPPACPEGEDCPPASPPAPAGPVPLALSPAVKEGFETITAAMSERDFDAALKEITRLERRELHTVFDFSLIHQLRATILMAQGELFEALEDSMLATLNAPTPQGDTGYFLSDDVLQTALRSRFILAASLRQFGLADETYRTLVSRFDIAADDPLHEQATTIRAALDSPEPLPALAKIVDNSWSYTPVRRIFTVTDVNGRLKRINAFCERRNLELDYQESVDWTLPASFGDCRLEFVGNDDTTFTIYEFSE